MLRLLLGACLALTAIACTDDDAVATTTEPPTRSTVITTTAPPTTLAPTTTTTMQSSEPPGVEEIPVDGVTHTEEPVEYETNPPVGGPHHPMWLACRPYSEPVENENAVHSLEHGAVWIAYSPDLGADQVSLLEDEFGRAREVLISPYPGLDSPVVVVAWERLLRLDGAHIETLTRFILAYRDVTAPETAAGC